MYSPSSSRSLIRSACSVVVLLGGAALGGRGAAAQQPDEALVSELARVLAAADARADRKSTRLNSSHGCPSHAVFCLKKKQESCTPPWGIATPGSHATSLPH